MMTITVIGMKKTSLSRDLEHRVRFALLTFVHMTRSTIDNAFAAGLPFPKVSAERVK
jgi:hypothetical protein